MSVSKNRTAKQPVQPIQVQCDWLGRPTRAHEKALAPRGPRPTTNKTK